MRVTRFAQALWIVSLATLLAAGCSRQAEAPADDSSNRDGAGSAEAGTDDSMSTTTRAPSTQPETAATGIDATTLKLDGITMAIPAGWVRQPITDAGPMSAKAVLQIPNENGKPGSVRITHYPRMRGMNEQNILRWLAQASKPDGSPMSRDDAKITSTAVEELQLTTVDIAGTIKATMREAGRPDQRMIATIIDHPKGPHFVVVVGDSGLLNSSHSDVMAFVNSVSATP